MGEQPLLGFVNKLTHFLFHLNKNTLFLAYRTTPQGTVGTEDHKDVANGRKPNKGVSVDWNKASWWRARNRRRRRSAEARLEWCLLRGGVASGLLDAWMEKTMGWRLRLNGGFFVSGGVSGCWGLRPVRGAAGFCWTLWLEWLEARGGLWWLRLGYGQRKVGLLLFRFHLLFFFFDKFFFWLDGYRLEFGSWVAALAQW